MSRPVKAYVIAELEEKIRKAKLELGETRERIAGLKNRVDENEVWIAEWETELRRLKSADVPPPPMADDQKPRSLQ